MGGRFPASHAASPRGAGAQEGHRPGRPRARRHRPHRPAGHLRRRARQLGDRRNQQADAPGHRAVCRHPSRRPLAALRRRDVRNPRRARERAAQPGRARLRQAQGRALRHLLRELQQHRYRRGGARGAGPQRRRDRGGLSRLLRHAQAGAGRYRSGGGRGAAGDGGAAALGRRGLRRDRAHAVVRPHAQVRMAAHPAQGSRGRAPVAGDVRYLGVRRRHRQEGRLGARPRADRRRRQRASCLSRPRPEHGRQGGRDAASGAQDAGRRHRALQRPWRHLGRPHREFRDRGEGRQARRPGGAEERHALRRVRMPAGGRTSHAGHGNDRRRAEARTLPRPSPDRTPGARLRIDGAGEP